MYSSEIIEMKQLIFFLSFVQTAVLATVVDTSLLPPSSIHTRHTHFHLSLVLLVLLMPM